VPDNTPELASVTPFGRVPDSLKLGAGLPVALKLKLEASPPVKVVELAEVSSGATPRLPKVTVKVKSWVASGLTPFPAVTTIEKLPSCSGVPEMLAVPVPPWKLTPFGNAPDSVISGAGLPVALKLKLEASPPVKVVELAEVISGAVAGV
jgi:hypothetical protein